MPFVRNLSFINETDFKFVDNVEHITVEPVVRMTARAAAEFCESTLGYLFHHSISSKFSHVEYLHDHEAGDLNVAYRLGIFLQDEPADDFPILKIPCDNEKPVKLKLTKNGLQIFKQDLLNTTKTLITSSKFASLTIHYQSDFVYFYNESYSFIPGTVTSFVMCFYHFIFWKRQMFSDHFDNSSIDRIKRKLQ